MFRSVVAHGREKHVWREMPGITFFLWLYEALVAVLPSKAAGPLILHVTLAL